MTALPSRRRTLPPASSPLPADHAAFSLPNLEQELARVVAQIPAGQLTTYGTLASALGDRRAAVWIARTVAQHVTALANQENSPWRRIVRADGQLPRLSEELHHIQVRQHQSEGMSVAAAAVKLQESPFAEFVSTAPLQTLQQQQRDLARRLSDRSPFVGLPETVGGLDVAYPQSGVARAAYVEWNVTSGAVEYQRAILCECRFPYISGYLAYRELGPYQHLLAVVQAERPLADVLMIDGSGQLHDRGLGVAAHLGVFLEHPTLGVSKKLLAGTIQSTQNAADSIVDAAGQCRGYRMRRHLQMQPIYVSPGHRCGVEQSREIVQACWTTHRLPEPTYLADRLSHNRSI